jgi:hypothetical protein
VGDFFPAAVFLFSVPVLFGSIWAGEEDGDGELSRVACAYKGRGFPDPATTCGRFWNAWRSISTF